MKNLFTLFLLFTSFGLFSQDRIPVEMAESQISINILSPSITYERGLTQNQSLHLSFGLQGLSRTNDNDDGSVGVAPVIGATYRNYYPRKKVKKELMPNSGNYVGLSTGYILNSIADNLEDFDAPFKEESGFFLGPVWGIQRNYKSGIHLGLSLGGGFITGKNTDFSGTFVGSFELGFVINTKSK
jgi:hypothetical protein